MSSKVFWWTTDCLIHKLGSVQFSSAAGEGVPSWSAVDSLPKGDFDRRLSVTKQTTDCCKIAMAPATDSHHAPERFDDPFVTTTSSDQHGMGVTATVTMKQDGITLEPFSHRTPISSLHHARCDSEGSTMVAFYAKPHALATSTSMPVPYNIRNKVRSSKENLMSKHQTNLEEPFMDFSSAVRLAIEQEGGQERVADLIWHTRESSIRSKSTKGEDGGLAIDASVRRSPAMYGTMYHPVERTTETDDSVYSGIGGDRFFMEDKDDPFSFFHLRKADEQLSQDGGRDSLRYSEYSVDTSIDTRSSFLFGNLFATLRNYFSIFSKNRQSILSSTTLDNRAFFETRKKNKTRVFDSILTQQPINENAPEFEWPPLAKMEIEENIRRDEIFRMESIRSFLSRNLDATAWLEADAIFPPPGEKGRVRFPEDSGYYSTRGLIRTFLFNPAYPEFTSLQQFVWSIIIGGVMGIYTAAWKYLIESCVEFNWVVVPTYLKTIGFFSDRDGFFPMVHYMWICPTFFGSLLSYIFASLSKKIPTQNDWIQNVHSKGVQESDTFWQLFFLSTLGMASGLSLGPELPLVLTAGMAGSYLGILTRQSVLQARVLNLVAASSAVGGFFGFPMAAALFVLEMPHRMGLQYFEALSPAIFGSIVAVLTNRMIIKNDVTGYFNYPFLTDRLPSTIFWHAIIFGMYGAAVGIGYAKGVLKLKTWVHDLFHVVSHESVDAPKSVHYPDLKAKGRDVEHGSFQEEKCPLVNRPVYSYPTATQKSCDRIAQFFSNVKTFGIRQEPRRAAVSGALAGFLVGTTAVFVPHILFWGEAQLQNLIDKGASPLPIFGRGSEPTADLTAWSLCVIDPDNDSTKGYSMGCSVLIGLSKIFVTGLSVGTGIIGGHFWGPLFTGCIASHFFTDLADLIGKRFGVDLIVGTYPCVAILCTMGASHVVTFRAHTSIMLILTLTISAFTTENPSSGYVAGNYSAVFPLLVVAVYVSLMISRDYVKFYPAQRCRGDIMALPEVLCEPGKEGAPLFVYYTADEDNSHQSDDLGGSTDVGDSDEKLLEPSDRSVDADLLHEEDQPIPGDGNVNEALTFPGIIDVPEHGIDTVSLSDEESSVFANGFPRDRLDEILSTPIQAETFPNRKLSRFRRVRSATALSSLTYDVELLESVPQHRRSHSTQSRDSPCSPGNGSEFGRDLGRVNSFGAIMEFQPSLLDQARSRASSSLDIPRRRRNAPT